MAKIKCRLCVNLDYNAFFRRYENRSDGEHFCGCHGMAQVDPDGEQLNLDHRGGCGFFPKHREPSVVQLTFDFNY